MKLRNKKTGEIAKLDSEHTASLADFGGKLLIEADGKDFYYDTLAELNEEWEDYTTKEPLIKDEKIREAVRAWAEVEQIDKAFCNIPRIIEGDSFDSRLIFSTNVFENLEMGKDYTITELCGEEEK